LKLLLDTHIALWAYTDSLRLGPKARALIADPANQVFVSAASIWEIAVKRRLARGLATAMPISGAEALRAFTEAGYHLLDISPEHAVAIETLPLLHGDPFDRILVAQALTEPLRLLTRDPKIVAYGDFVWAV